MLQALGSVATAGQDIILPSSSSEPILAGISLPAAPLSVSLLDDEIPIEATGRTYQLPQPDRLSFPPNPVGGGGTSTKTLSWLNSRGYERGNAAGLAESEQPDLEGLFPNSRSSQKNGQKNGQQNWKTEPRFQWGHTLRESLLFTSVMNAFRIATEPSTRGDLKGPFFKDYLNSVKRLRGWRDGDSFLVNYIGHPMQGAVSGFIYVQNEPDPDKLKLGLRKDYWKSRVKAMSWAFLVSTQFELGPFSEASLGNVGLNPSDKSQHPMGYVDLAVTPVLGTVWLVGEDALDRYLIRKIESWAANRVIRALARSFLNPARSFANLMRLRSTWYRDNRPL